MLLKLKNWVSLWLCIEQRLKKVDGSTASVCTAEAKRKVMGCFWSRYLPTKQHISVWRNLPSHLYSNIFLRTQINPCGSAWYFLPFFADFQHSGTLFLHIFFLWVYKLFWSPMGELSLLENTFLAWCLCASTRTWGGYFILAFISILF